MPIEMDPQNIRVLMPGRALVEILDKMGGMSAGGIFVPGMVEDRFERDSAYGKILRIDATSDKFLKRKIDPGQPSGYGTAECSWPDGYGPQVGDLVLFPRDVEMVLLHEERRYAIVNLHELIAEGPGLTTARMVVRDAHDPDAIADPTKKERVNVLVDGDEVEAGALMSAYVDPS